MKLKWNGYYKKLGSSARVFMITGCSSFTLFMKKIMAVLRFVFFSLVYHGLSDEVASCDWTVLNNEQEWTWKKAVSA